MCGGSRNVGRFGRFRRLRRVLRIGGIRRVGLRGVVGGLGLGLVRFVFGCFVGDEVSCLPACIICFSISSLGGLRRPRGDLVKGCMFVSSLVIFSNF